MKFNIVAEGNHKAEVSIDLDGKGGFAGSVVSPDFGTGAIKNGSVSPTGGLKGVVSLDGYEADFTATIAGSAISGNLKYGWFFSKNFTGTAAA